MIKKRNWNIGKYEKRVARGVARGKTVVFLKHIRFNFHFKLPKVHLN